MKRDCQKDKIYIDINFISVYIHFRNLKFIEKSTTTSEIIYIYVYTKKFFYNAFYFSVFYGNATNIIHIFQRLFPGFVKSV